MPRTNTIGAGVYQAKGSRGLQTKPENRLVFGACKAGAVLVGNRT